MLQAALPLEHSPAFEIVLRELGEDADEIHMTVSERAETARAVDPALIPAVDSLPSRRIELGILDVEHLDAIVIDVDVIEVIQRLQYVVAGVEQHVAARVIADALEKHLEGHAVVQVFAGMHLETEIYAGVVECIQDRPPAFGELIERRLDQAGGALRPWIEVGPGERARERCVIRQPEMPRCFRGVVELLDRPALASLWVPAHLGRGEGIEQLVIGGMHGHELALRVRR